jgi:hypothetical protein
LWLANEPHEFGLAELSGVTEREEASSLRGAHFFELSDYALGFDGES